MSIYYLTIYYLLFDDLLFDDLLFGNLAAKLQINYELTKRSAYYLAVY